MQSNEKPATFLHWDHDSDNICQKIEARKSRAKVILKTRNEVSLLSEWIDHHLAIFGPEGIVIFDHMSDDPDTFAIYEKYMDRIQIFQFGGMHNLIHDTRLFGGLFEAVRAAAEFYIFLDTDEFLYWHDENGTLLSDTTVVDNLRACGEKVVPGIWIENAPGDRNNLLYTFRENRIMAGIKGGKPMISSSVSVSGFLNHNIQLDRSLFQGCKTANLIIVHLKNLSADQRIKVNLQKLQSYNSITKELEKFGLYGRAFSVGDILAINSDAVSPGNARIYIQEIKSLSRNGLSGNFSFAGVTLLANGQLEFSDSADAAAIQRFIADPADVLQRAFTPPS